MCGCFILSCVNKWHKIPLGGWNYPTVTPSWTYYYYFFLIHTCTDSGRSSFVDTLGFLKLAITSTAAVLKWQLQWQLFSQCHFCLWVVVFFPPLLKWRRSSVALLYISLHNVSRVRRARKYNWCLGDTQLPSFSVFCHFHLKGHSWLPVCIWDTGAAANYSGSTTMQGHNMVKRCKYVAHCPRSLCIFFPLLLPHYLSPSCSSTHSFLLMSVVNFSIIDAFKLQLTLLQYFPSLDSLTDPVPLFTDVQNVLFQWSSVSSPSSRPPWTTLWKSTTGRRSTPAFSAPFPEHTQVLKQNFSQLNYTDLNMWLSFWVGNGREVWSTQITCAQLDSFSGTSRRWRVALLFDTRGDLLKSLSYAFHGESFKATDESLMLVAAGGLQWAERRTTTTTTTTLKKRSRRDLAHQEPRGTRARS